MKLKDSFKKSFANLKRPIVWIHYAIGTIGLWAVFKFIVGIPFVKGLSWGSILIFLIVYAIIDRTSHAILRLD